MHEPNATNSEAIGKSSYDVTFKLRNIEVKEKESKASAARQFKVDQKDFISLLLG